MSKYEVIINGVNYLIHVDGIVKKMGFWVTRYIEANDPDEAEELAIESIRSSAKLNLIIQNQENDPPMIHMDEIYEIASFDGLSTLEPGLGFYEEPA